MTTTKKRKRRKRYNPDTDPDAKWLEENLPFTITEEEFYRCIAGGPVSFTRPGGFPSLTRKEKQK